MPVRAAAQAVHNGSSRRPYFAVLRSQHPGVMQMAPWDGSPPGRAATEGVPSGPGVVCWPQPAPDAPERPVSRIGQSARAAARETATTDPRIVGDL